LRQNVGGGRIFASLEMLEHSRIGVGQACDEPSAHRPNAARGIRSKLFLRKKSQDHPARKPMTREALEQLLTEAVRGGHPEFETFAGVIVGRVVPERPGEANWVVKGVKYGTADRYRSGIVLSHCVEEAQREVELSH
jgi:hypothetical protein